MATGKSLPIAIFVFLALTVGCADERVSKQAEQIKQLESRVSKLETAANEEANAKREHRAELLRCTSDAETSYENALRINSTSHSRGNYTVPVPVADYALKMKEQKIQQCKALYGD